MNLIRRTAGLLTLLLLAICVFFSYKAPLHTEIAANDYSAPLSAQTKIAAESAENDDAEFSPEGRYYASGAAAEHSGYIVKGKVYKNRVPVFSGAGTNFTRLGTLKKDTSIVIGGTHQIDGSTWYYFEYCGETAWINARYVYAELVKDTGTRMISEATVTTAGDAKSGAGDGYSTVGTLNAGDRFVITGSKAANGTTWYCFVMDGVTAWYSGANISISIKEEVAPKPTPKPTANHEDVKNPNYKSQYYIIVYTKNNTVRVLEKDVNGKYSIDAKLFLCSTAISGKVTPAGLYSIDKRYDWRAMFGNVYAQYAVRFYGNYLFHSVPYYTAAHNDLEMDEYEKLGQPASLGCVRLCVRDAKWIYDNCSNGTQVRVVSGKNGPDHSEAEPIPSLNYDSKYKGWDPTDPHKNNPYNK